MSLLNPDWGVGHRRDTGSRERGRWCIALWKTGDGERGRLCFIAYMAQSGTIWEPVQFSGVFCKIQTTLS